MLTDIVKRFCNSIWVLIKNKLTLNMKATEFDKIDNTYFLIEEKTKKVCKENNVNFYNYLGVFKELLISYIKNKKHINVIENCDFNNSISTRAILNKKNFSTKETEINIANLKFEKSKIKLFDWLDNVKEPYFFILNPIFNYGAGVDYNSYFSKKYGYIKEPLTGINNLDIAYDYALYKIN
jgi:hypothetical protein